MGSELLVVSWDELFRDVVRLGKEIRKSGFEPNLLVAVARGGWVIGRIISDVLGLKRAAGITIAFYEEVGRAGKAPMITQPLNVDASGLKVLVVDDIVDSGATLKVAVNHVKERGAEEVRSAAPYVKPWSKFEPDYYVKRVDKWVVFPYEYFETVESLKRLGEDVSVENLVKAGFDKEHLKMVDGVEGAP